MANLIRGVIGIVIGVGVLIYAFVRPEWAYEAAKVVAIVVAILLIGAGALYLILGIRNLNQEEPPRKRKKKKQRLPREEKD